MTNNYNAKKALHTCLVDLKKRVFCPKKGFGVSFTIVSAKFIKNVSNISAFGLMSSHDTRYS